MESKHSLKRAKSECRQLGTVIGLALILALGVIAVWPWLRTAIWPHREIELYFSKPEGLYLGSEVRKLNVKRQPLAWKAAAALLDGPQSEKLKNSIPKGSKLLAVELEGKTAYVNLSEEFSANIVDKRQEVLALYSIVNTLTGLPGIERVQILIEGEKRETLHGNVEISDPLKADHSLIVRAGD